MKNAKNQSEELLGNPLHSLVSNTGLGLDKKNRIEMAEEFAEMKQIDVNERDQISGRAPIHWASEYDYSEVTEVLINAGAKVNLPDDQDDYPLDLAVKCGNTETVKVLIENGAIASSSSGDQKYPLHEAVLSGNSQLVELLIGSGADVNQLTSEGGNPLFTAARTAVGNNRTDYESREEMMDLLSENGARLDVTNAHDVNLLQQCSKYGLLNWTEQLIEKGFNVDYQDKKGRTALHFTVIKAPNNGKFFHKHRLRTLDRLLQENPGVNIKDDRGRTPLHYAGRIGELNAVNLLLRNGANVWLQDDDELYPTQLAGENDHYEVATRLEQAKDTSWELLQ